MLFENWDELDYVRDRMKAGLEAEMLEREFVLVGWGDVGFAHLFSNEPVVNPSDLGKVKMWSWQSDPIAQQFVRDCGGNPVPLPLPDVMPSLETGLVNAYVNSPLGAIALRWFTKVKYMTKKHNAVAIGATVLSKSAWESLTPDEQKIFREVSDKWSKILTKKVRLDNDKSYELLTSQGISLVEIPESTEAEWRRIATGTADKLADKVYTKATLDEVRRLLAEKRKSR
jgi:TRAP-type C4-dicarboxylate transport system substrate-binding protein